MADSASGLRRYLQIDLDDTLNFPGCRRRLEISTNVRDVAVRVVNADNAADLESTKSLFQGLRDLKKLKSLSFEPRDENIPGSLLLQTLAAALRHSHNLKDLYIANVTLQGFSVEEIATATSCLRRRKCLEEIALVGCKISPVARTPYLDPLVRGIADLPQLRVVHLQATAMDNLGTLSSAAVSALCQSKTLKELTLSGFDLTDDQFMTAARALETGKCLQELSLARCNFTIVTSAALSKMLRRNSTLKQLELTPKERVEEK